MLTHRKQLDVLYNHHMFVILLEQGGFNDFRAILGISPGQELQGLGNPLRSLLKAFPAVVLPYQGQNFFNMLSDFAGGIRIVLFYIHVCHSEAKIRKKKDTLDECPSLYNTQLS